MIRRATLPVLLCALLLACDDGEPEQPSSWSGRNRMTLVHRSGLEIELPEDLYDVETSATGWRIRPQDAAQMRNPFEIRIGVAAPARPGGEWTQSRRLHDREFHYRVDNEDAGSGGQMHVLRAWEEGRGESHLMLEQTVQVEPPAAPDFSDGWAIIALARWR